MTEILKQKSGWLLLKIIFPAGLKIATPTTPHPIPHSTSADNDKNVKW